MDSVSCSLQNKFGVFRLSFEDSYSAPVVGHFYTRNVLIFRIPSVYYAQLMHACVNFYAHV